MIPINSFGGGEIIVANQPFDDGRLRLRTGDVCAFYRKNNTGLNMRFYILNGFGLELSGGSGEWAAKDRMFDVFLENECGLIKCVNFDNIKFNNKVIPYSLVNNVELKSSGVEIKKENRIEICFPFKNEDFPFIYSANEVCLSFPLYFTPEEDITFKELVDKIISDIVDNNIYKKIHEVVIKRKVEEGADLCIRFNKLLVYINGSEI